MVIYYYGKPLKKGSVIIPYPRKKKYTIEAVGKRSNIIDYWVKEDGKDLNYLLNSKDNFVNIFCYRSLPDSHSSMNCFAIVSIPPPNCSAIPRSKRKS